MTRALSLVLLLLIAVGTPAAAQTRYKTQGNRFWVLLPDGWGVEARGSDAWVLRAGTEAPDVGCMIWFRETMETLWTPQRRLNEMIASDEFLQTSRNSTSRVLTSARIQDVVTAEIAGVRFLRVQAAGRPRVRDAGQAEAVILIAAYAFVPGQAWRLSCGMPQGDADRLMPHLDQMLTSFTIVNPDAGFNVR